MTIALNKKQSVCEGRTQSGQYGLFTNGMLAWSIQADGTFSVLDKRSWFMLSPCDKAEAVDRLGFHLIPSGQ